MAARRGLEAAYVRDRSDGGAGKARSCPECGDRMRHEGREVSPVETTVGRVRVSMARYACDGCGTSVRPRGRAMDIEGSMTPTARRMANLAGSSCCYAEADRLLVELAEVNYGAKRIERTTRSVGDDVESRREAALSGALSVVSPGGGGDREPWFGSMGVPRIRDRTLSHRQDRASTGHRTLDLQCTAPQRWKRIFEDSAGGRYLAFGQ